MKVERVTKLERRYAEAAHKIYENAARFMWDHDFVLRAIREGIYEESDYKQPPRYAQSFIAGVLHHCRHAHDKLTVYSYEVRGERLAITTEAYSEVSPQYIHEHCSHTGAFVYKDDHSKIWYQSKTE